MKDLINNSPILFTVIRCVSVYLFVVIAIRIFGKKELAQLSVTDLVFILLISNAVQNAMIGPDISLTGGLVAAGCLFVINYLLKQLLFRNERLSTLLQGKSLMLIYKGKIDETNLRHAEITHAELEAAVREHGVDECRHVDLAILEVDGNISVISNDYQNKTSHKVAGMAHRRRHKLKGRLAQN